MLTWINLLICISVLYSVLYLSLYQYTTHTHTHTHTLLDPPPLTTINLRIQILRGTGTFYDGRKEYVWSWFPLQDSDAKHIFKVLFGKQPKATPYSLSGRSLSIISMVSGSEWSSDDMLVTLFSLFFRLKQAKSSVFGSDKIREHTQVKKKASE